MPRRDSSSVLGGMSATRFLKDHWQKEPLVVRGAFPGLQDPIGPDELAGLACASGIDSRLIMERGGRKPWQVVRGPQRPAALRRLPPTHWTLLVESIDRHEPAVARLAAAFPFLPRWRMDDVMVSLAPLHGTVGAHIDSYDVFLLQGQGRRRWEVDGRARAEYRPGLDLRILKRFHAEDSWILDPGDMLYVPPGVGHRGVTVESEAEVAITYSIGFRAPSSADLLASLLRRELAKESSRLFADPGRPLSPDAGELSVADLEELRRLLVAEFQGDGWVMAAGEAVTAGGGVGRGAPRITLGQVEKRLARGAAISPDPGSRIAWSRLARGRVAVFVNGESRVLSRGQAEAASRICGGTSASGPQGLAGNPEALAVLVELLRAGAVRLVDDSPPGRAGRARRIGGARIRRAVGS